MEFLNDLLLNVNGQSSEFFRPTMVTVDIPLTAATSQILKLYSNNSIQKKSINLPFTFELRPELQQSPNERHICVELGYLGFLVSRVNVCVSKFAPYYMLSPHTGSIWSLSDVMRSLRDNSGIMGESGVHDQGYTLDSNQTSFFKSQGDIQKFYKQECIFLVNKCLYIGEDTISSTELICREVKEAELVGILHNICLLLRPYLHFYYHLVQQLEELFPVFLPSTTMSIRLPMTKAGLMSVYQGPNTSTSTTNANTDTIGNSAISGNSILHRWEGTVLQSLYSRWGVVLNLPMDDKPSISEQMYGWSKHWSVTTYTLPHVVDMFLRRSPVLYTSPETSYELFTKLNQHLQSVYFQYCFKWIYQPTTILSGKKEEEEKGIRKKSAVVYKEENCTVYIEYTEFAKHSHHTQFHVPESKSTPHFQSATDARKQTEVSAFLQYMSKESNVQLLVEQVKSQSIELVQRTQPLAVDTRVSTLGKHTQEWNGMYTSCNRAIQEYQHLVSSIYTRTTILTWKWLFMEDILMKTLQQMHPHQFYKQFMVEFTRQLEPLLLTLDLKPAITVKRTLGLLHTKLARYAVLPKTQWVLTPSFHYNRDTYLSTNAPSTSTMHGYASFLALQSTCILPTTPGTVENTLLRTQTEESLRSTESKVFKLLQHDLFASQQLHSEDGVDIPCPLLSTNTYGAQSASSGQSYLTGCSQSFNICLQGPVLQPVRQCVMRPSQRSLRGTMLDHAQSVGLAQGFSLVLTDQEIHLNQRPTVYDCPRVYADMHQTPDVKDQPVHSQAGVNKALCVDVTSRPATAPYPCFYKVYTIHVYHTLHQQQCSLLVLTIVSNPLTIVDETIPYILGSIEHSYLYLPSLPPSHALQQVPTDVALAVLLLLTPTARSVEYDVEKNTHEIAVFGNASYSSTMPDVLCGAEICLDYIPSKSIEFSSLTHTSVLSFEVCECIELRIQLPSRALTTPEMPVSDSYLTQLVSGILIATIPLSAKNSSLPSTQLFPLLFPLEFVIPTVQITAPNTHHYSMDKQQKHDNITTLLEIYRNIVLNSDMSVPNRLIQCLMSTFATPCLLIQGYSHKETKNILSLSAAMRSLSTNKSVNASLLPPPLALHGNTLYRNLEYQVTSLPVALQPLFTPSILQAYSHIYKRTMHIIRVHEMSTQQKVQWNKLILRKKHVITQYGQKITIPTHIHRKIIQKQLWIVQFSTSLKDYVDIDINYTLYNKFVQNITNLRNNNSSIYDLLLLHEKYVKSVTKSLFYTDATLSTSLSAVLDGCLSLCYDLQTNTAQVIEQFDVYHAYIETQFQYMYKQVQLRCNAGDNIVKMLEQRWNLNYFYSTPV